jgi:hypothetical protein
MGVPTSEVGYTSATAGRGDHEVHKGHVVALRKKSLLKYIFYRRRMEKISWTDHVRNEEVLLRVKEQRNILHEFDVLLTVYRYVSQ